MKPMPLAQLVNSSLWWRNHRQIEIPPISLYSPIEFDTSSESGILAASGSPARGWAGAAYLSGGGAKGDSMELTSGSALAPPDLAPLRRVEACGFSAAGGRSSSRAPLCGRTVST